MHLKQSSIIAKLTLILLMLALSSCSSIDKNATSCTPLYDKDGHSYYMYKSYADVQYPLNSMAAEKQRIAWLEKWIKENNLKNKPYKIIERKVINTSGYVKNIYYKIRF